MAEARHSISPNEDRDAIPVRARAGPGRRRSGGPDAVDEALELPGKLLDLLA